MSNEDAFFLPIESCIPQQRCSTVYPLVELVHGGVYVCTLHGECTVTPQPGAWQPHCTHCQTPAHTHTHTHTDRLGNRYTRGLCDSVIYYHHHTSHPSRSCWRRMHAGPYQEPRAGRALVNSAHQTDSRFHSALLAPLSRTPTSNLAIATPTSNLAIATPTSI